MLVQEPEVVAVVEEEGVEAGEVEAHPGVGACGAGPEGGEDVEGAAVGAVEAVPVRGFGGVVVEFGGCEHPEGAEGGLPEFHLGAG